MAKTEAINTATLTFGNLFDLVDRTAEITKLPTKHQLETGDAEILFEEKILGTKITIFKKGYILYERDGKSATVTTVDKCASPTFTFAASDEEKEGKAGVVGCICHRRTDSRGTSLISIVPKENFLDDIWYLPILNICDRRLDHNMESREENHEEFHLGVEKEDWDPALQSPSIEDELGLNDASINEKDLMRLALKRAKEKWTDKQREAIDLYFYHSMTDDKVGKAMNCSQQMANKHRQAAFKIVRNEYAAIKKEIKE